MVEEANEDRWLALPTTQIAVELLPKLARRRGRRRPAAFALTSWFNSSTGFSSGLYRAESAARSARYGVRPRR
jgi:hypothetical protein